MPIIFLDVGRSRACPECSRRISILRRGIPKTSTSLYQGMSPLMPKPPTHFFEKSSPRRSRAPNRKELRNRSPCSFDPGKDHQMPASGDLSEEQRGIGGTSGLSKIQQRSRKLGLPVIFTPMSKLRDLIVRRLPKQNRQIEEEPRQLPIRSRGKRARGASACLAESSGA